MKLFSRYQRQRNHQLEGKDPAAFLFCCMYHAIAHYHHYVFSTRATAFDRWFHPMLTRFNCVLQSNESVQIFSVIVVEQGVNSPNFNSNQCPPSPGWNFVVEKIQVGSSNEPIVPLLLSPSSVTIKETSRKICSLALIIICFLRLFFIYL